MMVLPNRGRVLAVMLALALAGGLLTLALLAKPTQAQRQGAHVERIPLEFTYGPTDCIGEVIDVTGTMRLAIQFIPQEDGTFIANSHMLTQAKGVGQTTGNEYVFQTKELGTEYYVEPGQYLLRIQSARLIIGKGSTPNDQDFIEYIFIINPDGTLKMESATFHGQCQQ